MQVPDPTSQRPRSPVTYLVIGVVVLIAVVALVSSLGRFAPVPARQSTAAFLEPMAAPEPADKAVVMRSLLADASGDGAFVETEARLEADDMAANTPGRDRGASGRVDDALIVRTASLELEVADVAAVLLSAREEIGSLGGYVAGSDEYDQGERRWASVTYRVPVDRFTQAVDGLRGLSDRVARESTQSQEVTATVVDLDARIANLRASEAALVEIMDRSGRIEDVLQVQMRLEDVRGQIERLQAQRDNLADQAALSTISVSWFTPVAAVEVAQESWSLAAEVDGAAAQTVQALQGMARVGVWLTVVALPLLGIPLLIIGVLFVRLRRRGRPGGGDDGPAALDPTAAA